MLPIKSILKYWLKVQSPRNMQLNGSICTEIKNHLSIIMCFFISPTFWFWTMCLLCQVLSATSLRTSFVGRGSNVLNWDLVSPIANVVGQLWDLCLNLSNRKLDLEAELVSKMSFSKIYLEMEIAGTVLSIGSRFTS